MAVAASFAAVVGIPLLLGVGLGLVPTRGTKRVALGASFPLIVLLAMAAASPFDVSDVGVGVIAALAILGWVLGFALADTVRSGWRVATR
jgi:hypothetical protein